MRYIVTSPFYPPNFQQFSHQLAKNGVTVLGIGQEPYEQLNPELKQSLTEYFRVNNLEDTQEAIRAAAFLFHKHGTIDRIESHNEHWLSLDATLREQFNITGVKPNELDKTKYKSVMKEYFKKAGVPVVPGYLVQSKVDIKPAIKALKLPVIAKPDNGVGAAATYKIMTADDLAYFEQTWDEGTAYFFEQFVDYPTVCTYDGLIDKEGRIVFETSLTYYHPPLDLVLHRLDNAFFVEKELDPTLRAYGQAIVKAFNMRERFFHIELFKTPDNDYIAIEYNNRPAGGFAMEVYNYAHELNLYELWAQVVTGQAIPAQTPHGHYCLAIARRDEHHYRVDDATLRAHYAHELKMVERIPSAFADLLGDTLYILTTPSRKIVDDMVTYISAQAH